MTIDKHLQGRNANQDLTHSYTVAKSNQCPAAEGTLWARFGLGVKCVYLISLTKEEIVDLYGNGTISYQTYSIT